MKMMLLILYPLNQQVIPMHGGVHNDPSYKKAGEIRHESFFDDFVNSTVGFVVNVEDRAINVNVGARANSEAGIINQKLSNCETK